MKSFTGTAAALLAAAPSVYALGSANVVNNCGHIMYLWNTPSSGGGGVQVDKILQPGERYSQTYQSLTNGNGWSMKLSPTNSLGTVMQFEYTYQGDGTIWYDMSYVNGNPGNTPWQMTTDSAACVPKQTYYRYSTDDANGMQSGCSSDVSVTTTLCPGGAPQPAAAPAPAPAPAPASVPAPAPAPVAPKPKPKPKKVKPAKVAPAPAPPTITTKVEADEGIVPSFGAPGEGNAAVAQVFTTFVTQVVTVDYTATVHHKQPKRTGVAERDIHQHQHRPLRHQHAHI